MEKVPDCFGDCIPYLEKCKECPLKEACERATQKIAKLIAELSSC